MKGAEPSFQVWAYSEQMTGNSEVIALSDWSAVSRPDALFRLKRPDSDVEVLVLFSR